MPDPTPAARPDLPPATWNATEVPYPDATIDGLFLEQVALRPEAVALRVDGRDVTYGELESLSSGVADSLTRAGLAPEERVAVRAERTLETVAGILGILRAGGAYLPVDPDAPARRRIDLYTDGGVRFTIGAADPDADIVPVPVDAGEFDDAPLPSSRLAYVIYTSGSTGRPKGVLLEHRQVVNRLLWMRDTFDVGPESRVLQKTALTFDPSVWEVLLALVCGGTTVLAPPDAERDPAVLVETIRREGVTHTFFVPGALAAFLEHPDAMQCTSLRHVLVGGSALPAALARRCRSTLQADLHNDYGPTETAMAVTHFTCGPVPDTPGVPIGVPNGNVRAYVVGDDGEILPVGATGELWIGGAQVARGYLNRPEETAARFGPDPFADDPAARVYRTGDLARWTPDGVLEFAGRIDDQIKLRGVRIEPGEVEATLAAHPSVAEAAVRVVRTPAGEDALAGYVRPGPETEPCDGPALRAFVAERLPAALVPDVVIVLDALPLAATGKVDRRALPDPDWATSADGGDAPATATEAWIADIWRDVLGLDAVGRDARFVDLGGHSLAAVKIAGRLRERLGEFPSVRVLFDHPTVRTLAAWCDARDPSGSEVATPALPADALSAAERSLWLECRLAPSSPAYNSPVALRLRDDVETGPLRSALEQLVAGHAALRSSFPEGPDGPVRRVGVDRAVALVERTVDDLDAALVDDARRPFDLSHGPLFRATVLTGPDGARVLLLVFHHLIVDDWSVDVLLEELADELALRAAGSSVPVRALAEVVPPSATSRTRDDTAFWSDELRGAELGLPELFVHERRAGSGDAGAQVDLAFPAGLGRRFEDAARGLGVTPFTFSLTTFALLLERHTGRHDLVLGTPVTVRDRPDLERAVGYHLNLVPVCVHVPESAPFADLVSDVTACFLAAYDHGRLPLADILATTVGDRAGRGRSPLDVVFVVRDESVQTRAAAGVCAELVPLHVGAAKFDVTFFLVRTTESDWAVRVEFRNGCCAPSTATRFAQAFIDLLGRVTAAPGQDVRALPWADAEHLADWTTGERAGRATSYPSDRSVDALFREQAGATPDAVALTAPDGTSLTYAELDHAADRLARRLLAAGVAPGQRVPLCLDRTPGLVVALLAVLRAGGAYVPLDPAYPATRLAFMLDETDAPVIVASSATRAALPEHDRAIIDLDEDEDADAELPNEVDAEAPAYVMYTSGSTGRPKGVVVPHRAIVRLVRGNDFCDLSAAQSWLALAPISFDASTLEIWAPLLNGGRIVLVTERVPSLDHLGARIADGGATGAWLTSSLFNAVVDHDTSLLAPLEQLLIGGEALSPPHAKKALDALPSLRLVNGYGPTENTTFTCCHTISKNDAASGAPIPIGRPIANTRIYVLDHALRPVPPGVPGELFAAGDGVALGYLDRDALTAARFLDDPFVDGGRMYRTGDRVVRDDDGLVHFLGRLDTQVKVRGHRIEPGEVEAALLEIPDVRQAAVIARADGTGSSRLLGYVVGPDADDGLREALSARLPESLVPDVILVLDELPRTANGKLDRARLPDPGPALRDAGASRDAETDLERQLLAVFRGLLGREDVGVDDDFFRAGGHSLLALKAVARAGEITGIPVPLRTFFETPTVAALARSLAERDDHDVNATTGSIAPADRSQLLPLSRGQEGIWLEVRLDPENPTYNTPVALRLTGPLDVDRLRRSVDALAARHESLRTVFPMDGGEARQRVLPEIAIPFDVAEAADDDAEARRLDASGAALFDLATGPLLRVLLVRRAPTSHVLLLTFHHVIVDDWSLDVLLRDLGALYRADGRAADAALPERSIDFADFAVWESGWLDGPQRDRSLAWWTERLAGARFDLDLPFARALPEGDPSDGDVLDFALPDGLAERLRGAGDAAGVTPFVTALSALFVLLARLTGETDLIVGTPVARRSRPELRDLVGYLLNMVALRVDLGDESASVHDLLRAVRRTFLDVLPHEHLPLEDVLAAVSPDRDVHGRSPLRVVFVMRDESADALDLGEVTAAPLPVETGTAKFDVTVFLNHSGPKLSGRVEYRSALFSRADMERFAALYVHVVDALVRDAERPVRDLTLLAPDDARHWTAGTIAGRTTAYPRDRSVDALFREQARTTPAAIALTAPDGTSLTYAELDHAADRLARRLIAAGVAPGQRVPLCLDRTPGLVVALLGVLRAGGAYVPLDPAYPASRLAFMLAETDAPVIVASGATRAALPEHDRTIVDLDEDADADAELPNEVDAEAPAYVMYTSGSTGRPKGAVVPHRAIVRLVRGNDFCDLSAAQSWLALAPISFDASTLEIWAPLLNGGRIVLVTERVPSLDHLGARIADGGATSAWLTSSLFNAVVDHDATLLAPLEQLLIGGEALSPSHVKKALDALPSLRLVNGYGPTENTTFTCCHTISKDDAAGGTPIPIGRPIANTRIYVLDHALRPVPPGVPGELFAAGDGVALGYLDRDALTAARFLDDPFVDGGRMYRTGDRVVRDDDGLVHFLGRLDTQVKVRGHRIEPGEVEAALLEIPDVRQAAVIARADGTGSSRLLGYVVGPESGQGLRETLAERLPKPLVPDVVLTLDELPRTANGKLDRRRLPDPADALDGAGHVEPRNATEERLLSIFRELLRTDELGIHDDFFRAGGHSLLAVKLFGRIESQMGVHLPVRVIFRSPTVAKLATEFAKTIGDVAADEPPPGIVPLRETGSRPPLFCAPGLGGHVFMYQELASHLSPEQPVFGLQIQDLDEVPGALDSVESLAEELVDRLLQVRPDGPYRLAGYSFGGYVALEMAQRLRARGHDVDFLGLFDAFAPGAVRSTALPRRIYLHLKEMFGRGPSGVKAYLVPRLRKRLPPKLAEKLLPRSKQHTQTVLGTRVAEVRRRCLAAGRRYRPDAYPGDLWLFQAARMTDWVRTVGDDGSNGWQEYAPGRVHVTSIPCEHLDLFKPPFLGMLADALDAALDGPADG